MDHLKEEATTTVRPKAITSNHHLRLKRINNRASGIKVSSSNGTAVVVVEGTLRLRSPMPADPRATG